MKRLLLSFILLTLPLLSSAKDGSISQLDWQQVEQQAKGQDVYFNAWGGSQEINDYLRWVAKQVKQKYGIELHHVKVTDISEATTRLLAEKQLENILVVVSIWFGLMVKISNP